MLKNSPSLTFSPFFDTLDEDILLEEVALILKKPPHLKFYHTLIERLEKLLLPWAHI